MDPTESPEPPESKPPASKFANKRNAAQKALDQKDIAELMLRGKSVRQIAEEISSRRDYSLSFQQVASDRRKILAQWQDEQNESITNERTLMLRKYQKIEDELWSAWHRSKEDRVRKSAGKVSDSDVGEGKAGAPRSGRDSSNIVKETRDGNAAYLDRIIDIQEKRAKLLGLYAPSKLELSGPDGAPIAVQNEGHLTEEDQDALLARHMDRLLAKRQKEASNGSPSEQAPGTADTA